MATSEDFSYFTLNNMDQVAGAKQVKYVQPWLMWLSELVPACKPKGQVPLVRFQVRAPTWVVG